MKVVRTADQLVRSIREFNGNIEELYETLPYSKAWYAVLEDGKWLFGPVKFVGHFDLSKSDYLALIGKELDTRTTEKRLNLLASAIEEGHPQHEMLRKELEAFCSRFGKRTNARAHISVVSGGPQEQDPLASDKLVQLLAEVYATLTPAQRRALQALIKGSSR